MKKFVALLVAVMLLVAAGSVFAAELDPTSGGGGGGGGSYNPGGTNNGGTTENPTDNPSDTPGTDTPAAVTAPSTVITVAPAVASVLRSSPAVFNLVLAALGLPEGTVLLDNSLIVPGVALTQTEVAAVLTNLTSIFRNAASLVIAVMFPSMTSPTSGVGVFGITNEIRAWRGHRMSAIFVPRGFRGASFAAADDGDAPTTAAPEPEVQVGKFLDAQGNVITGDLPADGDISMSAYMEGGVEYDPIVVEGELEEAAAPGTDTPGTDTPGTDTPGTDTPGTDTPGTDTPGTDTPGTDTPGTDTPGTDTPGTDTPGTDTPGTDTPGTDEPTNTEPDNDPGSSGGGCDAGASVLALAVLGAFVARKR